MEERTPKPVIWGWVLTGGVLLFGGVLGFIPTCDSAGDCQSKFAAFWSAPPNEIGDTLAGFAGALAFVWIIVTVMLQSRELKAQREELRLTRSEMEEQRKATQDMARSMKAQAAVFEDEQLFRSEARAKEVFNQLIKSALELTEPYSGVSWEIERFNGERRYIQKIELFSDWYNSPAEDEYRTLMAMENEIFSNLIYLRECQNHIVRRPKKTDFPHEILEKFERLLDLYSSLSRADQEKFARAKIREIVAGLLKLQSANVWEDDSP